jgi:hypothetical protein
VCIHREFEDLFYAFVREIRIRFHHRLDFFLPTTVANTRNLNPPSQSLFPRTTNPRALHNALSVPYRSLSRT